MVISLTVEQKIEKSTIDCTMFSPFLARVLYHLQMVENNNIPTMATDGNKVYYNRDFVDKMSLSELCAVRIHECLHVILGHHLRVQDRDHQLFNIAADYAINPLVIEAGYQLPQGALLDPKFASQAAEEIYSQLLAKAKKIPASAAPYGEVLPATGDPIEAENNWKALAKSCQWGKLPDNLNRAINEQIEPRPKLADQLIPLLNEHFPDDYCFTRPNRRSLGKDFVLPTLSGKTGHLVICIDTSGSIGADQLKEMWEAISAVMAIAQIDVIYADAEIASIVENATDISTVVQSAAGGGGTDFRPALAEAAKRQPQAIVYLTDGQGSFGEPVGIPIIWAITKDSDVVPPWGDRVEFV